MSRARTTTIIQMEATECGAASLGIILEYMGKWVPLEELRSVCNVSRDGSNAYDIVIGARHYGLNARGLNCEIDDLKELKAPFIVFWQFKHFLVVEGFNPSGVFINDPETGPRHVSHEAFSNAFTGLALIFEPSETFVPTGRRPANSQDLLKRIGRSVDGLSAMLVIGLLLIIPTLAVPVFAKIFIDEVLIRGSSDFLRPLILIMLVTAVCYATLVWIQGYVLARAESKVGLVGGARFLEHLFKLPSRFFGQRYPGDLAARLLANDRIAQTLGQETGRALASTVLALVLLATMLLFDVVLTGLVLAFSLVVTATVMLSRRFIRTTSLEFETASGLVYGTAASTLASIEAVKANGGEASAFRRWASQHARFVSVQQRLGQLLIGLQLAPTIMTTLSVAAILGVGSIRVVDGGLTVGGIVAFLALSAAFSRAVQELFNYLSSLYQVGAPFARIDDVERHAPAPVFNRAAGAIAPANLKGRLTMRGVTFGYSTGKPPLLQGFDLEIDEGKRVAVVGLSGSGKSTVARVAAGLEVTQEGEVLFDGYPILDLDRSLLASHVGWVGQESTLFEGSIRDNLTLWDDTVSNDEIMRAAHDAEINDVIMRRKGGYDSCLIERGADLSGGEAQRMEIARALATRPSLLILDEATSALDPVLERKIDENIRARGCSCLIIAHRLSTIRDADEIIVLDAGKVVERGNHEGLASAGGLYQKLIES